MPEIQTQTKRFGIYEKDRHLPKTARERSIKMRNKYKVKCIEYYVRFLFK